MPTILRKCKLTSNTALFKVKKQEKIESDKLFKDEQKRREAENRNLLESLDNYYKTQMKLLKNQLKQEQVDRKTIE